MAKIKIISLSALFLSYFYVMFSILISMQQDGMCIWYINDIYNIWDHNIKYLASLNIPSFKQESQNSFVTIKTSCSVELLVFSMQQIWWKRKAFCRRFLLINCILNYFSPSACCKQWESCHVYCLLIIMFLQRQKT